jgi:hypothetical protein
MGNGDFGPHYDLVLKLDRFGRGRNGLSFTWQSQLTEVCFMRMLLNPDTINTLNMVAKDYPSGSVRHG